MTDLQERFLCTTFITKHIDELIAQLQVWQEEGIEKVYIMDKRGYQSVELNVTEDAKCENFVTMRDCETDKPFILIS